MAGARAGLAGARSGLFMEQIRIVREMRNADILRGRTGIHVRPRMLCWENVPGAFSSGKRKGEDFRIVLEETLGIGVPGIHVPENHPLGDGDILGQPYWEILSPYVGESSTLNTGVCPRVVRGSSLWQILEPHPQRKYYLSRKACLGILRRARKRGKELPATLKLALEMQSGLRMIDLVILAQMGLIKAYHINQRNEGIDLGDTVGALMATSNLQMQTFVASFSAGAGASAGGIGYREGVAPTLKAGSSGNSMPSVLCINDQGGERMDVTVDKTATLRAQMGNHQPLIFESHGMDARYRQMDSVAPAMSARCGTGGNNVPLVGEQVYCLAGNTIDREPENGGNGIGYQENVSYTLTGFDRHAVFRRQRVDAFTTDEIAGTQSARQSKDATDLILHTCELMGDKDLPILLIRRLTPLECERLQGFPDGWTDIPGASDSARYKALGNSVAIPCVDFVMKCMVDAIQESERYG